MSRTVTIALATIASITTVGGCGFGTDPELQPLSAIFYGVVTSETNAPIPAAQVIVSHHLENCAGGRVEQDATSTSSTGSYRLKFQILSSVGGCVKLRFTAPGFVADSVERIGTLFTDKFPPDSFPTNLQLRALQQSDLKGD